MPKTEQKSVRLSAATVRKIEELGRIWGPVRPLSFADVIAAMADRVYTLETAKKEKAR